MNFFSSDEFLEAARTGFFADQRVRIDLVRIGGQSYRVLVDDKGVPLTSIPFLDVIEPVPDVTSGRPVSWLDPVETRRETLEEYEARTASQSPPEAGWGRELRQSVAPFIDWTGIDDFDEFVAERRRRSSRAFRQIIKSPTALDKKLDEPAIFTHHSTDRAHLEQCIEWKSAQYVQSGFIDIMQRGAATMFRKLADDDALVVSTLTSGDRLIAAHLGALADGVFSYWLPAYDVEFRKHSPGTVLLEEMIRASHARGDLVFDFLDGDEPYKYFYANAVRTIGEAGTAPMRVRALGGAEQVASRLLERAPRLHELARTQKRRLDEFRHR